MRRPSRIAVALSVVNQEDIIITTAAAVGWNDCRAKTRAMESVDTQPLLKGVEAMPSHSCSCETREQWPYGRAGKRALLLMASMASNFKIDLKMKSETSFTLASMFLLPLTAILEAF